MFHMKQCQEDFYYKFSYISTRYRLALLLLIKQEIPTTKKKGGADEVYFVLSSNKIKRLKEKEVST